MQKVDLDTAAEYYGISTDALRKRIKRGKADAVRESGRWYVFIPDSKAENSGQKEDKNGQLLEQLRTENAHLRQQVSQQNAIIFNLSEGIKLLEAPKKKQSFWRRLFSGGSDS